MTTSTTRRAWDSSTLASLARRAVAGSVVLAWARFATVHARNLVAPLAGAEPPTSLQRAIERSTIAALERETEAAVRASFIYRWFTTEPDSEVIVVDLRDTHTVGPVVAVLDRVCEWLDPDSPSATVRRLRGAYATLAQTMAMSRTGRTLAKLFAPPDPPEDRHGRE